MRRQYCFLLVLVILTLQATVAHVMPNKQGQSTPRQARIMAPLAGLLSFWGSPVAAANTPFDASIKQYFSGALSNSVISLRVINALRGRDYRPYDTLLASSICSDEINETPSSLISQLEAKLGNTKSGGVFHLGGLGGLPFVGSTGMGACLGHLPTENGKLVIVYGPHVGVSESGTVGKVQRIGRTDETDSCGAATAAYRAITGASPKKSGVMDLEQDYIIDKLKVKLGALADKEAQGGDAIIAKVTTSMFELINDLVRQELDPYLANPAFWSGGVKEVTLLGGIIVNRSPTGGEDYFQPLTIKAISAQGETSLYDSVFGDLTTPRKYV